MFNKSYHESCHSKKKTLNNILILEKSFIINTKVKKNYWIFNTWLKSIFAKFVFSWKNAQKFKQRECKMHVQYKRSIQHTRRTRVYPKGAMVVQIENYILPSCAVIKASGRVCHHSHQDRHTHSTCVMHITHARANTFTT